MLPPSTRPTTPIGSPLKHVSMAKLKNRPPDLSRLPRSVMPKRLKMFLKPVWEGKMHGVTKIGIFRPLFCVNMLGKSTNYSTGTRPLCSTF